MKAKNKRTREEAAREFLLLVEGIVADFLPHPTDPAIRIARGFTSTYPLATFAGSSPRSLPRLLSRSIIRFVWWGAPGSASSWEINAFDLKDARSVFWIETDFGSEDEEEKRFIIATGNSDERLIAAFFATDGKAFVVEGPGASPPLEITTSLPHAFLTGAFVSLFSAAKSWHRLETKELLGLDRTDPLQRRELTEKWLAEVVR